MGALQDMAIKIMSSGAMPAGHSPIVLSDPPPCGFGPEWKKIAATADAVREAGVPDLLNRWIKMTPAELVAADEAIRQQVAAYRNRSTTMKAPAAGSKEAQLRALRTEPASSAKPQRPKKAVASPAQHANTPPQIAPPAQPAQSQETTMDPQTATSATTKTTTRAKAAKPAKIAKPKKAKAAKKSNGDRARYDWTGAAEKAAKGTVPPAPDFSAPTHERFRPLIDAVVAAAKAKDAAALKAVKIKPTSSTPKALDRYRKLCVEALKAA